MSVSCQKQIAINVKSGVSLADAYWTLEESGLATDRVDKVHSVHCVPNVLNSALDATPGLFGNGLAYVETGATSSIQSTPNNANLKISSSNGWSMCFWFKMLNFSNQYGIPPTVSYDGRSGLNGSLAMVQFDFFAPTAVTFQIQDNNLANYAPANYVPVIGAWTFVHVFFDPVTTKVGYSINNGASVLDPTPGAVFIASDGGSMNFNQFWGGVNSPTVSVIVDEVLLKLSRILTPAEVTSLYNGGVGKTWPL